MGKVEPHEINANYCVMEGEAVDEFWEFRYDVPLDAPETLYWRRGGSNSELDWKPFPPFAEPPAEVMEFFHGPLNDPIQGDMAVAISQKRLELLRAIFDHLDGKEWSGETCVQISEDFQRRGWPSPKDASN